jgi:hypothetical protein
MMDRDRKRIAKRRKTTQKSQLESVAPIRSLSGHSREHAGKPAKALGLTVGCSRLIPAIRGTRDRKWAAGKALRSDLWSLDLESVDAQPRPA